MSSSEACCAARDSAANGDASVVDADEADVGECVKVDDARLESMLVDGDVNASLCSAAAALPAAHDGEMARVECGASRSRICCDCCDGSGDVKAVILRYLKAQRLRLTTFAYIREVKSAHSNEHLNEMPQCGCY